MEEEEEARTISTSKFKDDGEEQEVEKEKITPLPKLQLFIISIVLVCEPLTFAVLLPFIYFMLKDFHLSDDEKQIGSYAGWITSMFFVAQFCTAIIWGKISDRYGRRTVLLTGLLGNAISSCLFGMSKSLSWAIASRTLCGIMNGNAGAARSMVNEITDKTNKAKAFSLFGFCWGLGMIGGYLVKPAEHFPIIFGNSEFFKAYPYSLPCFAASTASIFGFSIGYFFLKESNPIVIAKNHSIERQQNLNPDKSTTTEKAGSLRDVPSTSIIVISGYFVYAIHSMVFDEVLPLYFTAPKYAGGLGISTQEFAEILSFFGLVQIVSQVVIYPRLTRHFDILSVTRWAFVLIVPVYVLFPELTSIQNWSLKIISPFLNFGSAISRGVAENSGGNTLTLAIGYVILLSIRCVTTASTFTGFNLMVNMSAPSEILGIVNG
ncbi:major facilitator superfamily domain-containing protein [Mycotypha africana]|uniref:major facilitator superfamily domain-containing protein n=1 Tax=Mycotypha africana TaxID=64632 RepID=UPI00230180EE|nr:major facilitator superfamily domain-containing protein [Mycotypha africana]KAI8988146.1 major facilitator superfamily domain-containing protein [Mycotypha africana]